MDVLTEYLTDVKVDDIISDIKNGDYSSLEKYVAFASKLIEIDTSDEYVERVLKLEQFLIDIEDIVSLTKVVNANHKSSFTFSTEKYESPINYAIINKSPIMEKVIQLGSYYDFAPNGMGDCPVFTAIEYGNHEAFKMIQDICMQEKGEMATSNYYTPLQHATVLRDFTLVKIIVEDYKADLEKLQGEKSTPLLLAVTSGNIEITKYLLEKGANVNAIDEYGLTPLSCATGELVEIIKSYGGQESKFNVLLFHSIARNLDAGNFEIAESDFEKYIKLSNVFVLGDTNLLECALLNGNVNIARKIATNKAAKELLKPSLFNICLSRNKDNVKNLKIINELFRILLDCGLKFDGSMINFATVSGYDDTINETKDDSFEYFELLFRADMFKGITDEELMKFAISGASINYILYMKEVRGVSLEEFEKKYGLIDCMFAKGSRLGDGDFDRREQILDYFIDECGADINHKDEVGNTVLHNFVRFGCYLDRSEWIEMLLVHGADVNIKNNFGQTPVDVAKASGRPDSEIFELRGLLHLDLED